MAPEHLDSQNLLNRRQVLTYAMGTGLVLILPMLPKQSEAVTDPWIPAGRAGRFKMNQARRVLLLSGGVVYITRIGPNELTALSARCPHQGCAVNWDKFGNRFVCPCHNATFSSTGTNTRGPARSPLTAIPTIQKGGQVFVSAKTPNSDMPIRTEERRLLSRRLDILSRAGDGS
ncbi:MAG: Rieske (2Fe-2S) protein [Capsulimonas sp.]|uniref:Rieske (2Fe-2S) protein n=1 Tax=Capsulimonas sp. TaxID=2494211 RepID=UPI00326620D7